MFKFTSKYAEETVKKFLQQHKEELQSGDVDSAFLQKAKKDFNLDFRSLFDLYRLFYMSNIIDKDMYLSNFADSIVKKFNYSKSITGRHELESRVVRELDYDICQQMTQSGIEYDGAKKQLMKNGDLAQIFTRYDNIFKVIGDVVLSSDPLEVELFNLLKLQFGVQKYEGVNIVGYRTTMSYGDGFKHTDRFNKKGNQSLKRAIQNCGWNIGDVKAVFTCIEDPDLIIVFTRGFNALVRISEIKKVYNF